jgi:hypothetical protein
MQFKVRNMTTKPISETIADSNQSGFALMLTDARIGLLFLDLAETTNSAEQRFRRIAEAHHAYQSILAFLPRLRPTPLQKEILSRELSTLKDRLQEAGVSIDDSGSRCLYR